jgi:hypothetical protein
MNMHPHPFISLVSRHCLAWRRNAPPAFSPSRPPPPSDAAARARRQADKEPRRRETTARLGLLVWRSGCLVERGGAAAGR